MINDMSTHIEAKKEDVANIVLMPGDPLRAKMIADTYLNDVTIINNVRNMLGFTGYYKNMKITVMGSGWEYQAWEYTLMNCLINMMLNVLFELEQPDHTLKN